MQRINMLDLDQVETEYTNLHGYVISSLKCVILKAARNINLSPTTFYKLFAITQKLVFIYCIQVFNWIQLIYSSK